MSEQFLQPEGGETQQAGSGGEGVGRAPPQPRHHRQEREGESPDRTQHQLRASLHSNKASGRHREASEPQVYRLYDEESGELSYSKEEENGGI